MLHQLPNHLLTNSLCDNLSRHSSLHFEVVPSSFFLPLILAPSHPCTSQYGDCLLGSAAEGQVSGLTLLDLSSAFDTLGRPDITAMVDWA